MRTTTLDCIVMLAAVAAAALAPATTQAQSDSPDPKRSSIEVRVDTIGKEDYKGSLLACSFRGGVVIRHDGGEQRVPLRDVVRIVTETTVAVPGRHDMLFTFNNDDWIVGNVAGARDEAVVVQTADLGEIVVPLEWIKRMDTSVGRQPSHKDAADWFHTHGNSNIATAARPDEDFILLTNGDIQQGFVTAIDTNGLSIETQSGDTTVPYPLALAVRFAAAAPSKKNLRFPIPTPYLHVTFRHTGRLTVTDLDWSADVARIRLSNGREFTVEAQRIVRVDVVGGRWEWLSAHQPISYQHTPMLSLAWEFKPDRNVLGNPITVGGQTFERGIGVHSRSILVYDLKGDYREFVTHFGMDDDSGPYADVSVVILVDGKRRFEKHGVRRRKLYGPVSIDVTLAKRIELIVDFGKNGDVQDRFNWVESALVR